MNPYAVLAPPTLDQLLVIARQQADDAVRYENWLRRQEEKQR